MVNRHGSNPSHRTGFDSLFSRQNIDKREAHERQSARRASEARCSASSFESVGTGPLAPE